MFYPVCAGILEGIQTEESLQRKATDITKQCTDCGQGKQSLSLLK